jgi:hypothetical protein
MPHQGRDLVVLQPAGDDDPLAHLRGVDKAQIVDVLPAFSPTISTYGTCSPAKARSSVGSPLFGVWLARNMQVKSSRPT